MSDIRIYQMPPDFLTPHPHNPRRDLGDLTELVDSIKAQGIRQPLLAVSQGTEVRVVIGHRRLAAAKLAGLATVPVILDELDETAQLELMLVENLQRSDLSPVEEAYGYQALFDLGVKVRQIAQTTGRAEKTVVARLQLTRLPQAAQDMVHTHQATLEDAAKIAEFPDDVAANLSQYLGTRDLDWQVRDAHARIKFAKWADPFVERCVAAGLTPLPLKNNYEQPKGYNWGLQIHNEDIAPDDLTKYTAFARTDLSIRLFRTETGPQLDTKRAAEAQARKDADDQAVTARALRKAFVVEYAARVKVPARHTIAIIAAVAERLRDGRSLYAGGMTGTTPEGLILAVLDHDSSSNWAWTGHTRHLVALYELLGILGYVRSTVEDEWVATAIAAHNGDSADEDEDDA